MASRELADAVSIVRDFENKHGVGGKNVFTKKNQFYLDALKFDPKAIIAALAQEIEVVKSDLAKIKQQRLDRIKSAEDCMADVANVLMKQPSKVKELSEHLNFPD